MTLDNVVTLVSALSAIAVPIILILIGNSFTRKMELEKNLQDDRIQLYQELLEPMFIIWMPDIIFNEMKKYRGKSKADVSTSMVHTQEYHDKMFKMSLIAPDNVVMAFNEYYQYAYNVHDGSREVELWSKILLEIRKSMGNPRTKLNHFEMLEWKITDIKNNQVNGKYPKK